MSYLQAIVIGLIQGVTELFPVSSLGHTVLVPALIGGSWRRLVTQQGNAESPYLAFVVGLHVATALALIWFFRSEWIKLIRSLFTSVAKRKVDTPEEKMIWLIIIATIPVGIIGLALEHKLRTLFAKPLAAAIFLTCNGLILLAGEVLRRRSDRVGTRSARSRPASAGRSGPGAHSERLRKGESTGVGVNAVATTSVLTVRDAVVIGFAQSSALLAGISRDGVCMVTGLFRGLSREDAAKFAFLLSAPPIFAAGLIKIPDLFGPLGRGIHGQILAGSVAAFITAFLAVKFLVRYFQNRTLVPFATYCLAFGAVCIAYFSFN